MKYLLIIIIGLKISHAQTKTISASYILKRELNGFNFTANVNTLIDVKNKVSISKLNQFENLMQGGKKIYDQESKDSAVVIKSSNCKDPKEYYFDYKEKKMVQILYNSTCKSKVLIDSKWEYPKWELHNEYKEISGYKTQKATAFISDREWTVYFTRDLNENIAPWKLIGLPGVVVEASENTSIYSFKLQKIEYPDKINEITKPVYKNTSSFDDFIKKSVKDSRDEAIFGLSQIEGIIVDEIDPETFPLYETIDFIEKREIKK